MFNNNNEKPVNATFAFAQGTPVRTANLTTISATDKDAANPPGTPDLVSPVSQEVAWMAGTPITFPGWSFSTLVFSF